MDSKEINERNDKKKIEKLNISISYDHVKISHDYVKWTIMNFCCKQKGNLKANFA